MKGAAATLDAAIAHALARALIAEIRREQQEQSHTPGINAKVAG